MVPARLTFFSFGFIMITRGLRSRSRFGRDRTGQYWRRLPKFRDRNETTYVWSYCSGKFREKFGRNSGRDGTGLLSTKFAQYHSGNSWMVLKWRISRILGNEIQNFKFGNSRFIFGIETGREMASPEWRDWDGTGSGLVLECTGPGNSQIFREKIWYPKNETGNADLKIDYILEAVS